MLCAYVICQSFTRTFFAFVDKVTLIVTFSLYKFSGHNLYKIISLYNAIKMTAVEISSCIAKRTHRVTGVEKGYFLHYSSIFYATSTHSGCRQTTPEYLVLSLSVYVIHTTCPLKTGSWHPKQYDLNLALTDGIVHLLF